MKSNNRLMALVLLISWASLLYYLLPIPTQVTSDSIRSITELIKENGEWIVDEYKQSGGSVEESDIYRELWTMWLINAFLIITGIITAALGLKRYRYWAILALFPIMYYLVVWYSYGSTDSVLFFKAMELKWLTASTLGNELVFLHRDILLPILFIFFIIWCLIYQPLASFYLKDKN